MPIKVVDASALGALAFGEPEAEIVAETLEYSTLAAPSLLWFEMASICRKKIASHPAKIIIDQDYSFVSPCISQKQRGRQNNKATTTGVVVALKNPLKI